MDIEKWFVRSFGRYVRQGELFFGIPVDSVVVAAAAGSGRFVSM